MTDFLRSLFILASFSICFCSLSFSITSLAWDTEIFGSEISELNAEFNPSIVLLPISGLKVSLTSLEPPKSVSF